MIRAIDTIHDGRKFRSRLEARWAVFYSYLGIPYEYEKEGFKLDEVLYLPDFWLPNQESWVEIKGQMPSEDESRKCALLASSTEKMVYLFYPTIPNDPGHWDTDSAEAFFPEGSWDNAYAWCICQDCGTLGIQFNGRSDRLPCKMCHGCAERVTDNGIALTEDDCCLGKCPRHGGNLDKGYTYDHPKLLLAYDAARMARFE